MVEWLLHVYNSHPRDWDTSTRNLKRRSGRLMRVASRRICEKSYLQRPGEKWLRLIGIPETKDTDRALLLRGQSPSEARAAEPERCQKETNCISMHRSKIDWGLFGRTKEIMDGLFFSPPLKQLRARLLFSISQFAICKGRTGVCLCVCLWTNCVALATLRLCRLSLPVKTTDDEVSKLRSRDATSCNSISAMLRLFVCVAVGRLQIETWCVKWHDSPFPQITPRPWQHTIYVWVAVTCEGISAPSSRSALQVFFFSSRCSSTENKLASARFFLIRSQMNSKQSERMKI